MGYPNGKATGFKASEVFKTVGISRSAAFSKMLDHYHLEVALAVGAASLLAYVVWGPKTTKTRTANAEGALAGLQNVGNSCFLNAVLQALASSPSVISWLNHKPVGSSPGHRQLWSSLCDVIQVVNRTHGEVTADPFTPAAVIGCLGSLGWLIRSEEQDTHEMFVVLMSTLQEEPPPPPALSAAALGGGDPPDGRADADQARQEACVGGDGGTVDCYVGGDSLDWRSEDSMGAPSRFDTGSAAGNGDVAFAEDAVCSNRANGNKNASDVCVGASLKGEDDNMVDVAKVVSSQDNELSVAESNGSAGKKAEHDVSIPSGDQNGVGAALCDGLRMPAANPGDIASAISRTEPGGFPVIDSITVVMLSRPAAACSAGGSDAAAAEPNGVLASASAARLSAAVAPSGLASPLSRRPAAAGPQAVRPLSAPDGAGPRTTSGGEAAASVGRLWPRAGRRGRGIVHRVRSVARPAWSGAAGRLRSPFSGTVSTQLTCQSCGHKCAVRWESFESLSLPLPLAAAVRPPGVNLPALLAQFSARETVHDVSCDACRRQGRFSKRTLIAKLPASLCLHLPRTTWETSGQAGKRGDHVAFFETLNMYPYTYAANAKATAAGQRTQQTDGGRHLYRLTAVIVHSGGASSGHFVTYRRRADPCDDRWFYTSDTLVSRASRAEVLNAAAYMLFYDRVGGGGAADVR